MTTKNAFPSFHRNPSVNKSKILLVLFSETWELLAMCWQEKNSEKPQIKSYSLESKLTSYEHLTSWQLGQLTKDGSSSRMYVGALNHVVAPGSSICRNTQDCCPPPIKSSGCFSLTDCAPILELPHLTLPTSLSAANVDAAIFFQENPHRFPAVCSVWRCPSIPGGQTCLFFPSSLLLLV